MENYGGKEIGKYGRVDGNPWSSLWNNVGSIVYASTVRLPAVYT
jgi:hypothetical protein